jgi:hypothetical protein
VHEVKFYLTNCNYFKLFIIERSGQIAIDFGKEEPGVPIEDYCGTRSSDENHERGHYIKPKRSPVFMRSENRRAMS